MRREDFPILKQEVYGRPLVYLDNAATTQKPKVVIDALEEYYSKYNSNIHRGVHYLSSHATAEFEEARKTVQNFINAGSDCEIIFTRGTTESINLVASSFGKTFFGEGDEVVVSEMEHHSNIVPWQIACADRGAKLKVLKFNDKGEIDIADLEKLLSPRTKIVAITHVSNSLGTVNPIEKIVEVAHSKGVSVLVDGAQAVAHLPVDVRKTDCDFYCFSGHKMYAPMGVGVLYGKKELLEQMEPYQGGGEMIREVTFEKTTYNDLPFKFEAGTPSVGDVFGLRKAIEYMQETGLCEIERHEQSLMKYALERLGNVEGMRFIGEAANRAGAVSFLIGDIHPYDLGVLLDHQGVAVRTGHHCTQPVMDRFGIPGTVRASFALYNTTEDIDSLVAAIEKAKQMLS